MASILEPSTYNTVATVDDKTTLVKENYLSEFETEDEKSVVRGNLGVYSNTDVYTQGETQLVINEKIKAALQDYVTSEELPAAISELSDQIAEAGYVRSDGSVPFTEPQCQLARPVLDYHLANKSYVDSSITTHTNAYDPHKTLDKVSGMLARYAKLSDVYTTGQLYTKKDIASLLSDYIKKDGSISFTGPVRGGEPQLPSHFTTKSYVQALMSEHNSDVDPHGFKELLRKTMSNYYSRSETYTKAQTYSREQLVGIIQKQMRDVVNQAIAEYAAQEGSMSDLRNWILDKLDSYVRTDGTTAYTEPQIGVAAVRDNEVVVLSQMTEAIADAIEEVEDEIGCSCCTWVTSGPVEATVGLVEEGTTFSGSLTLQQICDYIFYGKTTSVEIPDYASYGDTVCITMSTHGIGTLNEANIYKDGDLVATINPDEFILDSSGSYNYTWCDTDPFIDETEWEVTFTYTDGSTLTEKGTTKMSYPIFIGTIPYWWNVQEDVTFESLSDLVQKDPDNARFYNEFGSNVESLEASFNFADAAKRNIIVAIPYEYPDLTSMITPTQSLYRKAFARWVQPMYPGDTKVGVSYKIYVYKQPLVQLNQVIEFTFGMNEDEEDW